MENSGVEKPELPASSKRPAPYIHYSFSTHNTDEADVSLYYTLLALLFTTHYSLYHTEHKTTFEADGTTHVLNTLLVYSTHYSRYSKPNAQQTA
jgi:hypothetical protein